MPFSVLRYVRTHPMSSVNKNCWGFAVRTDEELGVSCNSRKFNALRMSGTGSPDGILRGVKLMRITGGAFWFPKGAHYHLVISALSVLSRLFIPSSRHL